MIPRIDVPRATVRRGREHHLSCTPQLVVVRRQQVVVARIARVVFSATRTSRL
jgi:hypothetical protein